MLGVPCFGITRGFYPKCNNKNRPDGHAKRAAKIDSPARFCYLPTLRLYNGDETCRLAAAMMLMVMRRRASLKHGYLSFRCLRVGEPNSVLLL